MTEKERVLMNIACELGSVIGCRIETIGQWPIRIRFGNPAPQFVTESAAEALGLPLKEGDIVQCVTNSSHDWGISEYTGIEETKYSGPVFLLREIGSERICRMGNERLEILRFMPPYLLYTGKKKQVYDWAYKAFKESGPNPDADYFKRCGGVEFDGDIITIWSRAHVWNQEKQKQGDNEETLYAQPRSFSFRWDKKTRLKDMIAAMRAQGFKKDYEWAPEQPSEGMGGCVTLTKERLTTALQAGGVAQ